MIKKFSSLIFVLLICISNLSFVNASNNAIYNPTSEFYVNDFADVLSANTEDAIFNICKTVQDKTTAQIVVVTVPNMNNLDIESYANTLFNRWGIGSYEKNNGVLLLLAKDERKIRIEVGYGLEGAINDAKAGRILDKYAITSLKNNNYDAAILDTVKQLQGEIYIEYKIDTSVDNPGFVPIDKQLDNQTKAILAVIGIIIFLAIITKGGIFKVLFYGMLFSNGRFGGRFGGGGGGGFGGGGGSSGGGGASRGF